MVTLLTTLKPFCGDDAIRQRNALLSWRHAAPHAEIMVFAPCPGLEELVGELGLRYYPDVPCVDGRLPLVGPMFEIAQEEGKYELQAFVNGDVVLYDDFLDAIRGLTPRRYLMIGRRWGTPVLETIDPHLPEGWMSYRRRVLDNGWFANGLEFFAYRRGTLAGLPTMCPGATDWDNLMVEHCLRQHMPVIDATRAVLCVHQDHPVFRQHDGTPATTEGSAAAWNRAITGGRWLPCIEDATHVLMGGRLLPWWTSLWHLRHRLLRIATRRRLGLLRPLSLALFRLSHAFQAEPGAYYR